MFALIHRTRASRRMNVNLYHLLLFIYKRALFNWLPTLCACDQILKNGREEAVQNVDLGLAPALLRETNGTLVLHERMHA